MKIVAHVLFAAGFMCGNFAKAEIDWVGDVAYRYSIVDGGAHLISVDKGLVGEISA